MQQQSYSGSALLAATGGALLAGLSLGYILGKRAIRSRGERAPSPLNLSNLRSTSTEGYASGMTTPAMTPRTGSADNLAADAAAALNVRMAVVVRQDVPMVSACLWGRMRCKWLGLPGCTLQQTL